jgi:hypothetical protein
VLIIRQQKRVSMLEENTSSNLLWKSIRGKEVII